MPQAPTRTPTRRRTNVPTPSRQPKEDPTKRYSPEPDHCPAQWTRTVRRVRDI